MARSLKERWAPGPPHLQLSFFFVSIKAFKLFLKWFEGLRTENVTVMQLVKPCLCLWALNIAGLF